MENQPAPALDGASAAPDPATAEPDPLAFTPVPRRKNRADGLNADVQRDYIHMLALCGSSSRAAVAVGKSRNAFEMLRRDPGAEDFNRARQVALDMYQAEEARRRAVSAEVVGAEAAAWRPAPGPFANAASRAHLLRVHPEPVEGPEPTEDEIEQRDMETWRGLMGLCDKYLMKLEAERRCRLAGRIAEADLYVRQICFLECAIDAISGDGMKLLRDYRAHGYDLRTIAETPMTQILGELRRRHFNDCGDPERPEHPPRHLLQEVGDFKIEPVHPQPAPGVSSDQHRHDLEAQYARDAAAQIEWEARARADWAEWHARQPDFLGDLLDPDTPTDQVEHDR